MKEINFKRADINNLTLYHKGGFDGIIYIYSYDFLLKLFRPSIKQFINLSVKKHKLINIFEKNIPEHIMIKPDKLIYIDGEFNGYTMPKITDSIRIDCVNDYRKLVKAYRLLFQNMEILHQNGIIINDVKPDNILYEKNQNPIFIDIDSMGVDEYAPNHINMKSQIFRKVDNYYPKMRNNDPKVVDKLKLLACFAQSLERKCVVDNKSGSIYDDKPLINILNESNISDDFKNHIANILIKKDNLDNALSDIDQIFLEEEMSQKNKTR